MKDLAIQQIRIGVLTPEEISPGQHRLHTAAAADRRATAADHPILS